ncbi:MAG: sodium-dependent transporter [Propionibacteriaceae bacterium]|jgi:NSS family neurotransmitter:Na+ symporter|nr:sodium-dependent transporter [Propionibacteriaceae bacterium]
MAARAGADPEARPHWSGQMGFVLSAIGSAVGLGNLWRFPAVAYENGGGAFLIPYLVAFFTAGVPILWLDYAIGHRYRGSPPLALRRIQRRFEALGWFQVGLNVLISLFYAALLAWSASYFVFAFTRRWGADTETFFYDTYLRRPAGAGFNLDFVPATAGPLALVWLAVIVIIALGVRRGVERANVVFIPLLTVAFVLLVGRSMYLPGAETGLDALFTPNLHRLLEPSIWIAAYGQIFFTLSISYGIMMTYSSYRRRKANQTTTGLVVALANGSFEMLAGIGVFCALGFMAAKEGSPIDHLVGDSGAGLAFITYPRVVSEMPSSAFFGVVFFGSMFMAGFTSLLSNVQVVVASAQDKFNLSARQAALFVCGPMAVFSLLLFGTTSAFYTLDVMDHWVNNVGIVVSAVALSVLVVWVARKGRELTYHLTVLSTLSVGRIWRSFAGTFGPFVLVVWLVQWLYSTYANGYHSYPRWFLIADGWGAIAVCGLVGVVFTVLPWRSQPDDFTPWPEFSPQVAQRLAHWEDTLLDLSADDPFEAGEK